MYFLPNFLNFIYQSINISRFEAIFERPRVKPKYWGNEIVLSVLLFSSHVFVWNLLYSTSPWCVLRTVERTTGGCLSVRPGRKLPPRTASYPTPRGPGLVCTQTVSHLYTVSENMAWPIHSKTRPVGHKCPQNWTLSLKNMEPILLQETEP